MKKFNILLIGVIVMFVSLGFRCGGGNTSDPSRGFDVQAVVRFLDPRGGGFERPALAQNVNGFITANTSSTTIGFRTSFNIPTMNNFANVRDAKVPARWSVSGLIFDINCTRFVGNEKNVGIGGSIKLACETFTFPMIASPNSIDADNPPQAVQIQGEGFSNEYGMPKVAIYNEFGQLKSVVSTTSGNIGKGIDVQLPNLASYYNGNYIFVVNNVNADESWQVIGTATILIYGNEPPDFPNPPDPCVAQLPNCLY